MSPDREDPGILARAAIMMRVRKKQRGFQKISDELEHWKEETEAQERKKSTCMALLILALGDDFIDVIGAAVSFGLIQSITFPVPGIIRMLVSATEREQKPERLLRAIFAMTIEAIPWLNLLPTTTVNLLIDFLEAYYDAENAKNNVERLKKELRALIGSIKVDARVLRQITSIA